MPPACPRTAIAATASESSAYAAHRADFRDFTVLKGDGLVVRHPHLADGRRARAAAEWTGVFYARSVPGGRVRREVYDDFRARVRPGPGRAVAEGDLATAVRATAVRATAVRATAVRAAAVRATAVRAAAVRAAAVRATAVRATAVRATAVRATPVRATPVRAAAVRAAAVRAAAVRAAAVRATAVRAAVGPDALVTAPMDLPHGTLERQGRKHILRPMLSCDAAYDTSDADPDLPARVSRSREYVARGARPEGPA
nr:M81 family metallopeptidase [Streptomyces blattellae]